MTDRKKLIVLLKGNLPYHSNEVAYWSDEHIGALADYLIAHGVVVREKGEWVDDQEIWRCDKCLEWLDIVQGTADMNYCPHCGADMRKGESG